MVDILSAVLTDGLVAVEAAPHPKAAGRLGGPEDAEALGDGVHSADVILDILVPTPRDRDRVGTPGRQREAGPSLTIATPVAHPMAAGCHGDPGGTQARLRAHGRLRPPPIPSRDSLRGACLMERSEILAAPKVQGAGLELFGMEAAP